MVADLSQIKIQKDPFIILSFSNVNLKAKTTDNGTPENVGLCINSMIISLERSESLTNRQNIVHNNMTSLVEVMKV